MKKTFKITESKLITLIKDIIREQEMEEVVITPEQYYDLMRKVFYKTEAIPSLPPFKNKTLVVSGDLKLTDPKIKRYVDNKKVELAKMKEEGDKKFGGKISNFLKEAGHGLHSLYTSPIRALLWTISLFTPKGSDLKNPKIREKIANIIYAAGMIGFAGFGIYESVKSLVGVSEAATAIIDGVKGGKSVSEIVTDVPIVAKAFAT